MSLTPGGFMTLVAAGPFLVGLAGAVLEGFVARTRGWAPWLAFVGGVALFLAGGVGLLSGGDHPDWDAGDTSSDVLYGYLVYGIVLSTVGAVFALLGARRLWDRPPA